MKYRFVFILVVMLATTVTFAAPMSSLHDPIPDTLSPVTLSSPVISLVGQDGGAVSKVAVQGAVAYVIVGTRLVTLDISDPADPRQLGEAQALEYQVADVAVAGDYAYTVTDAPGRAPNQANYGQGLQVIDVRNPAAPAIVGSFQTIGAKRVAINGPYAYVNTEFLGMYIVDISNPTQPFEAGYHAQWYFDFVIAGNYAYAAVGGFKILDLSDPVNPVEVGQIDINGGVSRIAICGDYAYALGGYPEDLHVIDISEPSNPVVVSAYDLGGYGNEIVVHEGYLYVAQDGLGLRILDVHDPTAPFEVSVFETEGWAEDVAIIPGYALVADGKGLQVIDVQDPAGPWALGSYSSYNPYGVAVNQSYAYTTASEGGFNTIDLSTLADPVWVGEYETPIRPRKMAFSDQYAYLALEAEGLRVLDVGNPANPVEIGVYDTPGSANDVGVKDDLVYVADGPGSGLRIIDVSNPTLPEEVGHFLTPGDAVGVAVAGNYAYVGAGEEGLRIVDVSDPAQPHEVGVFQSPYGAYQVIVEENIAYIADNWGLRLVDVSDPSQPLARGAEDLFLRDFAVKDRIVYAVLEISSYYTAGRLKIYDARDPDNLELLFDDFFFDPATGIVVDGFYIYVGCGRAGLQVFVDTLRADYQLHLPMTHFSVSPP